jgi:hypothetical protein
VLGRVRGLDYHRGVGSIVDLELSDLVHAGQLLDAAESDHYDRARRGGGRGVVVVLAGMG